MPRAVREFLSINIMDGTKFSNNSYLMRELLLFYFDYSPASNTWLLLVENMWLPKGDHRGLCSCSLYLDLHLFIISDRFYFLFLSDDLEKNNYTKKTTTTTTKQQQKIKLPPPPPCFFHHPTF